MTVSNSCLRLSTLGRVSLSDAQGRVLLEESKPLLILAYLARREGHRAPRDHVASLLWPTSPRKHRKRSLRQALHMLRKAGAEGVVQSESGHLILEPHRLQVDVWDVAARIGEGAYEEAVAMADGVFLLSMRDKLSPEMVRWAEAEDIQVEVMLDEAYLRTIEGHRDGGDLDRAIQVARAWVALNPLAERRVRVLMAALLEARRPLEATQQAKRFRALVQNELGDAPDAAFDELEREAEKRLLQPWTSRPSSSSPAEAPEPSTETAPNPSATLPPLPAEPHSSVRAAPSSGTTVEPPSTSVTSPPSGVAETARPSPDRRPVHRTLLAAVVILGVLLGSSVVSWNPGAAAPEITLDLGYGRTPGLLTISDGGVVFHARDPTATPPVLASSNGTMAARMLSTRDGTDLEILDEGGHRIALLSSAADEVPLEWSPDGRRLLYRRGWYDNENMRYRVALASWRPREGESDILELDGFDGRLLAAWSPDGSRIAVGGGPRLVIVTPAGAVLATTAAYGHVGQPSWSVSGRRLVVDVWDGTPADVHLFDTDGFRLTPLVRTLGDETSMLWLDDRYLLALSRLKGRTRLLLVDALGREATILEDSLPIGSLGPGTQISMESSHDAELIWAGRADAAGAHFIDSLSVQGPALPLGVGEYVVYRVNPLAADGSPFADLPRPPTWDVRQGRLAHLGGGLVRAVALGVDTLLVTYDGWRTSAVPVKVLEALRRNPRIVWTERWSPNWTTAWVPHGDPRPDVRPADELPEGWVPEAAGALAVSGDQNYSSGVTSRRRFSTIAGLTIETWSRTPLTRALFQYWGLGLDQGPLPDPLPHNWSAERAESWVCISCAGVGVYMPGLDPRYRIPLPDSTEAWRQYAYQVAPDGRQSLFVDGRLHVRAPPAPGWIPGDSARIVLAGQSIGTTLLHGGLRVLEGELYTVTPTR